MIEEKVQIKNKTTKARRACTKVSKEQTKAKKMKTTSIKQIRQWIINKSLKYKFDILLQMEAYFCATFYKNFLIGLVYLYHNDN